MKESQKFPEACSLHLEKDKEF